MRNVLNFLAATVSFSTEIMYIDIRAAVIYARQREETRMFTDETV